MSNELKATKGPWVVSGRMTKFIESRIGGGLVQEVAACGPTDTDGGYGEVQKANAHLIAAAPDGYSLALNVESMIVDGGLSEDEAWAPILAECRDFLAKARGEKS